MLEKGKIGGRQAVYLNVTMIVATALLGAPALIAAQARQDAWLSSLLATLLGIPLALLTVKLSSLYPGKTLIEYLEEIIGRWPGKVLGLLYLFYFIHITSIMIREYGAFLADALMPQTPLIVFNITVVAISAYTIKLGLEVLARALQVFFPWIVFSLALTFLLATPQMDLVRLLPVFESGAVPILKGALAPMAWHGEIIAFAMIIPFLAKPDQARSIALYSIGYVGVIFFFLIIGSLATFGPGIASMNYPVLNEIRLISITKIIDRMEPFIIAIWVTGGLMKVAFFYYVIVLGSAQWLKIRDYRPLVLPLGAVLVALSIAIVENTMQLFNFIAHVWPFYALTTFEMGIPAALLAIALAKKKGGVDP
jgi:spore germination protein KB